MTVLHEQNVAPDPPTAVVWPAGDIDIASADQLRADGLAAVNSQGSETIIVDLAGVTFMDSTGLGALVTIRAAAADCEKSLKLRNVPAQVHKILEITALADIFEVIER